VIRPAGLAGSEIICRTLADLGARHVFGLPGTQNTSLYEAIRRAGLDAIVPIHELAAAFMAGAYFRTSGMPGVLTTIPGPGLAYTIAGLAEARLDSAAVLYIVNGQSAAAKVGYGLQSIDQRSLLAPVTKAILTIRSTDDSASAVRTGWTLSLSGEPGPVAIVLQNDDAPLLLPSVDDDLTTSRQRSTPVDDDLTAAWLRIAKARKPVLFAGQGAISAAAEVQALAERLHAPLLTTPSARGILSETSPLSMAFDVLKGHVEAVNELIAESDLVVILGAKLGHNGSAGFDLTIPTEKTVRIDTSQEALETVYPASHAVVANVAAFLKHAELRTSTRSNWTDETLARYRGTIGTAEPQAEPRIANSAPALFFAALRSSLPKNVRLVTDTGMHQVMARRHFQVTMPGGLLTPSDFQSMGFGLPAAMAAHLADPSRPVVALIGDGGFRMMGFELATAVREKIPLTVMVFCDRSLNQIRLQQLAEHGSASATDIGSIDLAAFSDAIGCDYAFVKNQSELETALGASLSGSKVTLVEIPVGDSAAIRSGAIKARAKSAVRRAIGGHPRDRLRNMLQMLKR
jgi:acetolactate synthase-1/2/3 large subunit